MANHYVYRMDHDTGFAPHVSEDVCILCGCKITTVEAWAKEGSWVVGIGGNGTRKPNKLIYAMKVEETLSYRDFKKAHPARASYLSGRRILPEARVLMSRHFFYFGDQAQPLPPELSHIVHPTQGCKRLSDGDIALLNSLVLRAVEPGEHGKPNNASKEGTPKCGTRRKASVCRSTHGASGIVGANRILFLRVGMDLGFGGLGPLFPDGRFEYVPIPEDPKKTCSRSLYFSQIPARSGGTLQRFVPPRYRAGAAHYDPEFETFTYGDPTRNKRRQLLHLARNDMLVFYAGLRPPDQRRGSRLYVIGYFTVQNVHDVTTLEPWPPPALKRLWANAHFRRRKPDVGLVVVEGMRHKSRSLEAAVALSDDRQLVLPEMERRLGLTGSVMRAGAGRWIPPTHVAGVERWLRSLKVS